MQIVLSGNRVIAYGESFLAMGGTVICEETGKAYSNATIAEVEAIPADIDSVGYEYHAGIFVPVAPYGKTKDGYLMAACFECGTPRSTDISISDVRDRLNTYATILVSYPVGSECTCEKDGVILTATDTGGSYAFNLPSAGVWSVKITDGTDTAEKTIEITKRWQFENVAMSYFAATIKVTYPVGSVCTCTDGVTTHTATDTSGNCVFVVDHGGEWTIKSTYGEHEVEETVTLATSGEEVSITLKLWFFNSGWVDPFTGFEAAIKNHNDEPPPVAMTYNEAGNLVLDRMVGDGASWDGNSWVYSKETIDITQARRVCCKTGELGSGDAIYLGVALGTDANTAAQIELTASNGVFELDVSTLSGSYYFGFYHRNSTLGNWMWRDREIVQIYCW